jgi:hypothetical protein
MADAGELKARATLENQQFLKAVGDMVAASQKGAKDSADRFEAIGSAITGISSALASLGALAGLTEFAKSALEAQEATAFLEDAFVALNGPTEETKKIFDELSDLEMKSMFDFEDTIGPAAKNMMLLGVSAEDTQKQMTALVDAAAGLKMAPEWITETSAAMATMQSHTVATAKDMKALEKQFGPEVWQPIATMLGTDVPGAMEAIKSGLVSTKQVAAAVTEDLGKRFEGAAERSMQGWKGAMHVLDESTEDAMVAIGGAIKGVLDVVAPIIRGVSDAVQALAEWFNNLSGPVKEAIVIVGGITATFVTIAGVIGGLTTALGGLGTAAAALALNPATLAIAGTVAALALLGKWVFDNWPAVKAAFVAVGDFLGTLFSPLITLWKTELDLLWGAVQAVFGPLVEYWKWAWGLITQTADTAINLIKGAFDYVVSLISAVPGGDSLIAKFKAIGTAWDEAQAKMAEAAKADEAKKKSSDEAAAATHRLRNATRQATDESVLAAAAAKAEADECKKHKDETEKAIKAVDSLTTAYKTLGVTSEASVRAELAKAQAALYAVTLAFEGGRASTEDLRQAQIAMLAAQEKLDNHLKGNLIPDLQAASQAAAAFANVTGTVTTQSLAALDAALATTTQTIAAQKAETDQLAGAYHQLGIKSRAEMDIMVADAYGAWAQIEADQNASQHARLTAQAKYLRQVKEAADAGYGTWTKDQDAALKQLEKQLETSSGNQKTVWTDFGKEVSTIVTNFAQDMAKALFDGDMSWGEKAKTMLKDLGEAAVSVFITPFTNALKDLLSGALADLLGGKGLGGIFDGFKKLGGIFGGGGGGGGSASVPGIPGMGGGSGGAGGMGGIMGSLGGLGGIGAIVGAGSSIFGNFQMAGMNKTLDLIEKEVRYSQIHLLHILENTNDFFHRDWWTEYGLILDIKSLLYDSIGPNIQWMATKIDFIKQLAENDFKPALNMIAMELPLSRNISSQTLLKIMDCADRLTELCQWAGTQGERSITVNVSPQGLTTAEAARALGNQIAQNLATQLMPQ